MTSKNPIALTAITAAVMTSATVAAALAEPAFVGTWSQNRLGCRVAQDKPGAPLILTTRSYDQNAGHCTFPVPKGNGPSWVLNAKCAIEGDKQNHTFIVQTTGNKLTIRESGIANKVLVRCPTRAK